MAKTIVSQMAVERKRIEPSVKQYPASAADRPGNALVIADDIGIFLAIVRSLGRIGVTVDVAASISGQPGFASRYIRDVHHVPSYLSHAADWVAEVRKLCLAQPYDLIIPTSDSALALLDRHGAEFGTGQLALPGAEALDLFSDKAICRDVATKLGIAVAKGILLDRGSSPEAIIAQLGLPMICKPRRSFYLGDREDKQWARIITEPEQLAEIIGNSPPNIMIAESFFHGDGIGVSVLANKGKIELAWQHRRLQAVSATGKSSIRKGEPVDRLLYQDVARLADAVSLDGVAMFEFRHNSAAGSHILIEVNPRFWGSLPLAVAAGADFPAALWRQSCGRQPVPGDIDYDMVKIDLSGEWGRVGSALKDKSAGHNRVRALHDLIGLISCLIWPRRVDSWADDDPAPFFEERKKILGQLFRKFTNPR